MTPTLAQAAEGTGGGAAELWVFVVVGAIALGSAVAMVLMRNAVHAALMLVANFFAIAVLYALMEAQFLAVIQIIIYAGAIMVLFLFVLMLLGVSRGQVLSGRIRGQTVAATILGVLLFLALFASVAMPYIGEQSVCGSQAALGGQGDGLPCLGLEQVQGEEGNVRSLGFLLFTDYVWPFEVTSVLLVIAAIGVIVLGRRTEDPRELVDRQPTPVPARRDEPEGPGGSQ